MRERQRSRPSYAKVAATLVSLTVLATSTVVALLAFGGGKASAVQSVSCGDTITTDVTLHHNLVNCPNNGIIIGADNVTLDLNGHTIDGDAQLVPNCPGDVFCDTGVVISGHKDVVVQDGRIQQFDVGAWGFQAEATRLRGLTSTGNNFAGAIMSDSPNSRMANNLARRNGLETEGSGLMLFGSHDALVRHNTVAGNGDNGIFLGDANGNVIARNTSIGNPFGSIIINGSRNAVRRNQTRSAGDIIVVGNGNVIKRNDVSRSLGCAGGGCGIGISFEGGHGNVIARNHVAHVTGPAIRLAAFEPDTPPALHNVVRRNHVRRADDGILVQKSARHTLLRSNHGAANHDDGTDVNNPTTKVTRNEARRNADLGIEAVRGVIDGGGNKASGNGDPRQCTNIVCS
jgi:large repetitive protein